MQNLITVDNIKCNGCATTVINKVKTVEGVTEVTVDIETGNISFVSTDEAAKDQVISTLKKWGYPLAGKGNGIDNAKSYVSCMIGRIDNMS